MKALNNFLMTQNRKLHRSRISVTVDATRL